MYDFCSLAIKIKLLINYAKIKAEKVRNSIIVTYSKILNHWNNSEEYLTYNSATFLTRNIYGLKPVILKNITEQE